MNLADLIELQTESGIRDQHLIYIGERGFAIAHTDEERASETPLAECRLHQWLLDLDEAPVDPGVYVVWEYEPDAYSESNFNPYELEPFD